MNSKLACPEDVIEEWALKAKSSRNTITEYELRCPKGEKGKQKSLTIWKKLAFNHTLARTKTVTMLEVLWIDVGEMWYSKKTLNLFWLEKSITIVQNANRDFAISFSLYVWINHRSLSGI